MGGVVAGVKQEASPQCMLRGECLELSVPDLQVVAVSAALARRYRALSAGLAGTSLLLWLPREGHGDVLDAIASAAETPSAGDKVVQAGIVKMVIMRYHFAEIHECSLKVEACGSHRCTLHIAWNDSVQRWEDVMVAVGLA